VAAEEEVAKAVNANKGRVTVMVLERDDCGVRE
jgi:hypothetical protein